MQDSIKLMLNHRKKPFSGDKYRSLERIDDGFEEMTDYFNRLRNAFLDISRGKLNFSSADFEKAISFGATHIRVGSAIFGERIKPPE